MSITDSRVVETEQDLEGITFLKDSVVGSLAKPISRQL